MKKLHTLQYILIAQFIFCSIAFANTINNSEGRLSSNHLQELAMKIEKYVTTNGQVDPQKITRSIQYFTQKRSAYENTLYVYEQSKFIDDHFQNWETAEKKANKLIQKEREGLIAFDEILRRLNDLLTNYRIYNNDEIENRIGTLGLFIAATDTILHEHYQYDLQNMLVTLGRNFFRISKKPGQLEASNLLYNQKFLNQIQIRNLEQQGFDLSKLNPPQSAFWQDNQIESYNPDSVVWYGEKIFPNTNEPQDFYYNRIGDGTVKIKAHWFDKQANGKEMKKSITLRLGIEIHSGTLGSHLIRSLGFYAIPSTYRPQVRLFLGDVTYEEFLNQLKHLQGETMYDLSAFITSYNQEQNYVTLKGVCLEAYPDDDRYQKIGPFRTGRNGFDNRREYRAWLMNGALLSLNDTQDKQTRMDVIRKDKKSEWQPLFMIADLGYSMGSYLFFDNMGAVNDYAERMTSQFGKNVMIWWANGFDGWENYQQTTASDIRWWIRRAHRLSAKQIYRMAINSGFPEPVARLYTIKIQKRINDFILAFDLENELSLYQPETYQSVHREFPKYVTEKGQVTNAIEEFSTTNASLLGPFTTLNEILTVHAQNLLQEQIEKPFQIDLNKTSLNTDFDFGRNRLSYNIQMGRKRSVKQNHNKSQSQKRFQVRDIYEISIPVGLAGIDIAGKEQKIKTPLSYSIHYRYTYIHSYAEPLQAAKSRFFNSLLPWNLTQVKQQLKTGESLLIESSQGYEFGTLKAESEDFFQFEVTPFQWAKNSTEQILITKTTQNLEITTNQSQLKNLGSHINLSAGVKAHIGFNKGQSNGHYQIYRIDLNQIDSARKKQIDAIFQQAIIMNDYSKLRNISQNYEVISDEKYFNTHFGIFLWDRTSQRQLKSLEFNVTESAMNTKQLNFQPGQSNSHQLFIARQVHTSDRAFGNFWIKDFDFEQTDFLFDLFGDGINVGTAQMSELHLAANEQLNKIDQMELNLQIRRFNKFITKDLFVKNYLEYFSDLTGIRDLFYYQFADGVLFVSPTEAIQTWQINQKGTEKILQALEASESICTSPCQDRFNKLQYTRAQISLNHLSLKQKKKLFTRMTDLIQKQINTYLGNQFQRLSSVIHLIGEENLWLRTRISNIHRTDIPISRNKYDSIYSRPIGKYQGDSRLKEIKKKYYLSPMMDYETVQFDSDSQL